MPGRSSAVKEEPAKTSSPPPLLGAAGSAEGGAGKDNHTDGPGLREYCQPQPLLLKERAHGRSTVY